MSIKMKYKPTDDSVKMFSMFLDDYSIGKAAREVSNNRRFPSETTHLMALTVASWCVGMCYKVADHNGQGIQPVNLYSLSEQPAGSGKTSVAEMLSKGFNDAIDVLSKQRAAATKEIAVSAEETEMLSDYEEQELLRNHPISKPISNLTDAGLNSVMQAQQGWFIISSTEQDAIDVMIGGKYSDGKGGFGDVLRGFNAEYGSTARVTRQAFAGVPHGGVMLVSQNGTIDGLFDGSGSTGLIERFLMVLEDNLFGRREKIEVDASYTELFNFNQQCKKIILDNYKEQKALIFEDLKTLRISKEGMQFIFDRDFDNEKLLADGGRYSAAILRGVWAKWIIQIQKVAATLHVFRGYDESVEIQINTVRDAHAITKMLLEGVVAICEEKGIVGSNTEDDDTLDYLERNCRGVGKKRNDILNALRKRAVFKQYGKKAREKAAETLNRLILRGEVAEIDAKGGKRIRLAN